MRRAHRDLPATLALLVQLVPKAPRQRLLDPLVKPVLRVPTRP